LVFIGQESIPVGALQKVIQNLTAEQRKMFYWFPQVEQNDLQAFYQACKLFVYPSKAEGFGITAFRSSNLAGCRFMLIGNSHERL